MNTQLFAFFSRLTTCTCCTAQWLVHYWRWLTQTELADCQWEQTHESENTNTNSKLTQTAATPKTGCTLPANSALLGPAADAASMMEEQMQLKSPSHDDTSTPCKKNDTYKISKQLLQLLPNQTALTFRGRHRRLKGFICSKLKIINQCTSSSNMP